MAEHDAHEAQVEKSEAENQIDDFTDQLSKLLDKLVPPDEIKIKTAGGEEIVLPGAIPARRQIKVFRIMEKLLKHEKFADFSSTEMEMGAIVAKIAGLAMDEEVANNLGEMFKAAYPDALPDGADPLDHMPLEELVVAIVPFTERFVKKLGQGMMVLTTVMD